MRKIHGDSIRGSWFALKVELQECNSPANILVVLHSQVAQTTLGVDPAITHDAPGSSSTITSRQHQRTTVVAADRSTRCAVRCITGRSDDGLLTAQAVR